MTPEACKERGFWGDSLNHLAGVGSPEDRKAGRFRGESLEHFAGVESPEDRKEGRFPGGSLENPAGMMHRRSRRREVFEVESVCGSRACLLLFFCYCTIPARGERCANRTRELTCGILGELPPPRGVIYRYRRFV